ncbi:DAK2 domain-containing protein [Streptomyces otsuchiensis]|uniref:DAK2 domain-containing protein n=1 Tax=Streptomyces otsuchiensis TaxID=2681388 RepID=UPI00103197BA|nr:DAK2 domain-containing protein [Streptomyces otsuchiensis]
MSPVRGGQNVTRPLDAAAVRRWCRIALDELGQARESIDAINVYPVADGDTGTNLYLTVESAAQAVEAGATGTPTLAEASRTMAHGALIGAQGNSGTILAQLLRGMAQVLAERTQSADAATLSRALRQAANAGYEAVARPVEGTMLTVASAAADAAEVVDGGVADVTAAACAGARRALAATPGQLDVLARAGVVDAGGSGLVTVLEALDAAISGRVPGRRAHHGLGPADTGRNTSGRGLRAHSRHDEGTGDALRDGAGDAPPGAKRSTEGSAAPEGFAGARDVAAAAAPCGAADASHGAVPAPGPSHEVIFLLDAEASAVRRLRHRLDSLGDSLVVVGGEGLWNVHVHTDDPGGAVEAGVEAGRPHRIRITHLGGQTPRTPRAPRAVLCLVPGDGLAALCREAGAVALTVRSGEPPGSGELAAAIHRAHAEEVVLLPNDDALRHAAAAAAEQVRVEGVRVAVIPTRSPVQGLAALAVHTPDRRFDEDVVAMTSAAGATRFGELAVAASEAWTSAGICQAGDVLGLIDSDVAVIGADITDVATAVVERMLSAGGELVTLVVGADAPAGLAAELERWVRRSRLGVDTVVCAGRQAAPLLIGVE